jgi:hypothetical protein
MRCFFTHAKMVNFLCKAEAKFIVPDWGDKADSGIGLSYRTARLHTLVARYNNPMPGQLYPPVRDYEFCYKVSPIVDWL